MSHETAVQVITEGNGRHFHPDVVAAFFSCESLFKTICAALADPEDGAKVARSAPKSLSIDAAPARAN